MIKSRRIKAEMNKGRDEELFQRGELKEERKRGLMKGPE